MEKLFLVRHGETVWNEERRYIGLTDLSLSEKGREQADRLAQWLANKPIEVIFSSPLKRSRETAEIIASKFNLEVVILSELREIDFGEWEGLTYAEIKGRFGDLIDRWLKDASLVDIPAGENWSDVMERVSSFLSKVATTTQDVGVAVTHGGLIKALVVKVLGMKATEFRRFLVSNGSLSAIGFSNQHPYLRFLNDTCHLEVEWDF
jgi:alpha-ribazole phosphatase